jgi:thiol-disulfide isomerase/thioredoxin
MAEHAEGRGPAADGKVVLVDFWAYSCINCQRAISHVNAWSKAYGPAGLEVVGAHTPEYAFEHVPANVAGAQRLGITYPIQIRWAGVGEGLYTQTEILIRRLLTSANPGVTLPGATEVPDLTLTSEFQTPETYLGAGRAQGYQGNTPLRPGTGTYTAPGKLAENAFALDGTWAVTAESITSKQNAVITLNYTAEDVYLYVGGTGTVTVTAPGRTRAYQVRGAPNIYTVVHTKALDSGTLKVSLSPGLSAYSFTFG